MKLTEGNYFGHRVNQRKLNETIFTVSRYSANSVLPLHYHQNIIFGYVLHGEYHERTWNKDVQCRQGTMIVQPAGTEHSNKFDRNTSQVFNMELGSNRYESLFGQSIRFKQWAALSSPQIDCMVNKIMHEIRQPDSFSSLVIESVSVELIATCARNTYFEYTTPIPPEIRKVKEFIDLNFSVISTLSELASLACISPFYLARKFKKHMYCTIGEYVRRKRVEEAMKLLRLKNLKVSAIALDCGFSHLSHFVRVFKHVTGYSPQQYRNLL